MEKQNRKHTAIFTVVAVLTILILGFAVFTVISVRGTGVSATVPSDLPNSSGHTYTVWYVTPNGTTQGASFTAGSTVKLETPDIIDGYTFLGWKDEAGNIEYRSEVKLWEDTYYAAVYAVALGGSTHQTYLAADENGFYHPNQIITRGQAAEILYSLLAVNVSAKNHFLDLTSDDECYEAAAALCSLGVFGGSRFYPEDSLTLREYLSWLSSFYPTLQGSCEFSDLSSDDPDYVLFCSAALHGWIDSGTDISAEADSELTIGRFVHLLNRVMGRSSEAVENISLTGTLLDVPFDSEYYADIAEAAVPHEYTLSGTGEEIWTSSKTPAVRQTGYFMLDLRLFYVQEDGTLLTDGEYRGSNFDENGMWTSGNDELDEVVHGILEEFYDPDDTQDEYLVKLYNYITQKFKYTKGDIYDSGAEIPTADIALDFFSNGAGNCYGFACAFCELARAIGYDATAYSGTISGETQKVTPHSWVEVIIGDETLYCDPEMEWSSISQHNYRNMYMMSADKAARWKYNREQETE